MSKKNDTTKSVATILAEKGKAVVTAILENVKSIASLYREAVGGVVAVLHTGKGKAKKAVVLAAKKSVNRYVVPALVKEGWTEAGARAYLSRVSREAGYPAQNVGGKGGGGGGGGGGGKGTVTVIPADGEKITLGKDEDVTALSIAIAALLEGRDANTVGKVFDAVRVRLQLRG